MFTPKTPLLAMQIPQLPLPPSLTHSLLRSLNTPASHPTGPTPLGLHLWQAWLYAQSWPAALKLWPGASPFWNPASVFPATADPLRLTAALAARGAKDFTDWQCGVAAYAGALRPAKPTPARIIWQQGRVALRDYGGGADNSAPLVLAVPSLVNRAAILDLLPGRSLLRALAATSRVWLLDWQGGNEPTAEQGFDLADFITQRLLPAIERAQATGRPVVVLGHCLGGLLALAAAQLSPQPLAGLALLAAPWDFGAYSEAARDGLAQWRVVLAPWLAAGLPLPAEVLQILFTALQPLAVYEKFRKLGAGTIACDDLFVAIEDWLNDGVALPARAALDLLGPLYGQNATLAGNWQVAGQAIDPAQIPVPTLVVAPANDTLVPQASAAALAKALPNATLLAPPLGHIGMAVGRQADTLVWTPLSRWLAQLPRR